MRGLWLEEQRLRFRDDLPRPIPAAGEALVRVILSGICNTDIELTRGYYPFTGIPGHEFVGLVEEGPADLLGMRVVGEINAVCHTCGACRAGRATHCEKRTVLGIAGRHGAFADYLVLPAENLHRVPETMASEEAIFTEPLAAALEIQEQIAVDPAARVLVVGDGKLGQLVARTLALRGCAVSVVGRHRSKLDLLTRPGIDTIDLPSAEKSALPSALVRAFDIAVDCTGSSSGFLLARQSLRPRGILVMKSTYAGQLEVNASSLVVDEITLVGSRCGPFAPALDLLRERRVDVKPLIHKTMSLKDGLAAFDEAQRPGVLKVLMMLE